MIDLHTADLFSTSYADAFAWIEASAVETQRVDFKEELPELGKIVETCCAFANAYGGMIVIGFADPNDTKSLVPARVPPDLSDRIILRIDSSIVDRIRPGIRFEIARFPALASDTDEPKFGVIRVPASPIAPHEVLPKHVFPVRRDRRNAHLGLPEIESMLRARDGSAAARERWTRISEPLYVQFGSHLADPYGPHIGVRLNAVDAHLADMEHSRTDDEFVMHALQRLLTDRDLEFRPLENGILVAEASGGISELVKAPFAMELWGNGTISARLKVGYRQSLTQDVEDLASVLAASYDVAAQYYRRKRFAPLAQLQVSVTIPDKTVRLISQLPDVHNLGSEIDLSTTLPSALGRFVERLWRSGGSNPPPESVQALLGGMWEKSFRGTSLERPWYGGPGG